MKLTIETENPDEIEFIFKLLKRIDTEQTDEKFFSKLHFNLGDSEEDPKGLFGIWKDNPRSLHEIRLSSWNRNKV